MRRFLIDFAMFAALQSAMLWLLLGNFHDAGRISPLMPAIIVKHERLRSAPSPRMILIGGSNLLFGIDSKMIDDQTDYHPVNMGVMRSLRLDYIVSEIDESIRAGDVVVISLEHSTLNGEAAGEEGQVIMSAMAERIGSVRNVSWPQRKQLLDEGAVEYLGIVFRQAIENISDRDENADDPDVLEGLNAYGDLTRCHDFSRTPPAADEQTTLTRVNVDGVRGTARRMNEFIESCRRRDVTVLYAHPPLCRTHYQRDRDVAERFHALLVDELAAPVITEPSDMVFEDDDFIGLSYHLRGAAVQERTQRLIHAVQRALANQPPQRGG